MKMNIRSFVSSKPFVITVHSLIWLALLLVPIIIDESPMARNFWIFRFGIIIVFLSAFFYLNAFLLIPRLLLQGKIISFILSVLACIGFIVMVNLLAAYLFQVFSGHRHHHFYPQMILGPVFFSVVTFALSTSFKITSEWFRNEKIKKEMENEKLTAELAFLKSQVNPHFLFNILNNICSLARKKSDDTENAIIKLSQIMRYMLYESKDEKVSLEKEIEYLQNYIELQRMRLSGNVDIRFIIEGRPELMMIEPMLLIPFVENAFKHGVSYLEECAINIQLKINPDELVFKVENPVIKKGSEEIPADSGTGLKNVLRRLELLYPGKHEIAIDENEMKYLVNLIIRFR
jgi:two-component system, LytTR family, sensor kinase